MLNRPSTLVKDGKGENVHFTVFVTNKSHPAEEADQQGVDSVQPRILVHQLLEMESPAEESRGLLLHHLCQCWIAHNGEEMWRQKGHYHEESQNDGKLFAREG